MTNVTDAQAIVDGLEALHQSLLQGWLDASNAGEFAASRGLKEQADRAGDQLIDSRQHLLDAIDGGSDVTALLKAMAGLADKIKQEKHLVDTATQTLSEVSSLLDLTGKVMSLAASLAPKS